jgi:UDP-N-acetylglucosamine transferase subunit ALG13
MVRPSLLVASTGGHLTQLIDLAGRLPEPDHAVWVTFASDQTTAALAGAEVETIRYIPPRGYWPLLRAFPRAIAILARHRPSMVVSTGSGIALAFLPLARLFGARSVYIESATRSEGPSATGSVLRRLPWVERFTQHESQAVDGWNYAGSVFDGFAVTDAPARSPRSFVVTLGTMETYGFRRLLDRLVEILPDGAEVLWQTGVTDLDGLDIDGRMSVPSDELEAAIRAADVVIAHAGTGTALTSMRLGKRPVLVPRRARFDEHVDDHQLQTAELLAGKGLALSVEVDELDEQTLEAATASVVTRHESPPNLRL